MDNVTSEKTVKAAELVMKQKLTKSQVTPLL
jgi:hypothetical protein